ncbi:MAG: hypothetical protein WAL95_04880 [Candidatus Acidiferrales bacterium]
MTLFPQPDYRLMCDLAGAKYLGVCDGIVLFENPKDNAILRIYELALRSPDDIRLALKAHEEKLRETHAWERVTTNERN